MYDASANYLYKDLYSTVKYIIQPNLLLQNLEKIHIKFLTNNQPTLAYIRSVSELNALSLAFDATCIALAF